MTYQDFGFVKRLIIPSLFQLFGTSLSENLVAYSNTINFILISFCIFLLLKNYLPILKNRNYFVLFFIFYSFFLSPHSIIRFTNAIFHDGFSFYIFTLCFLIILRSISSFHLISVSFLSVFAILNHETYLAFFVLVLFVIAKFRGASVK